VAWRAQAQQVPRDRPQAAAAATATNPLTFSGDGDDSHADDGDEMAEAVLGWQLGK